MIGRDRSTIYREANRNSVDGVFLPGQAQQLADQRMLGKQRRISLVTLTVRKSGFALAGMAMRFYSANVHRQMNQLMTSLPNALKHTLTLDNGKEFSPRRQLSQNANIEIDFARPYHAWERGSNEHFNGLLRQDFPP